MYLDCTQGTWSDREICAKIVINQRVATRLRDAGPKNWRGIVKEMQTVIVFGNSLLMSGIRASLQACAGLQVLTVDAEVHDAVDRVGVLRPDVVLFDLGAAQRDFAMTLWKAQPDLLLIGVDLATNQALVLSGHRTRAYTTEDLVQLIQRHDPDKAERG